MMMLTRASIFLQGLCKNTNIWAVQVDTNLMMLKLIGSGPAFIFPKYCTFDNLIQPEAMKKIKVRDKEFGIYLTAAQIDKAVGKVADALNHDLKGKVPLFLVVLNGAFMFAADLLKKIELDNNISFVKLSSYSGTRSSQVVRELIGLNEVVKGRTVVIIEDIIDTGLTMKRMLEILHQQEAAEVRIAALVFKPGAFEADYKIDYIGMEIPNDFILGYGLDYDGFGRNLPDIYKIIE